MKKVLPSFTLLPFTLLSFILLLSVQTAAAQDNQKSADPEQDRSAHQEEDVSKKTDPAPAVWPKPFTPSEEIGADSQISLPTDI